MPTAGSSQSVKPASSLAISFAADDRLRPPPPVEEDEAKLAKRQEEKAAARAAQAQRAPSAMPTADLLQSSPMTNLQ